MKKTKHKIDMLTSKQILEKVDGFFEKHTRAIPEELKKSENPILIEEPLYKHMNVYKDDYDRWVSCLGDNGTSIIDTIKSAEGSGEWTGNLWYIYNTFIAVEKYCKAKMKPSGVKLYVNEGF